jgi:hypothetical protein
VNNGAGRAVGHHGLLLEIQPLGTFAGPDTPFGAPIREPADGCAAFSYLRNVERGRATDESYWVDWDLVHKTGEMDEGRDPHLRMHCLSPVDEVAIAVGEPPHHRYRDDYLRYVVRSRLGEDLESQFVTVHEPYEFPPFIDSARPLRVDSHEGEGFVAAMEINLVDGRRDIVIIAEHPGRVAAGGVVLDGQVGLIRMLDGQVQAARLVRGTLLSYRDWKLEAEVGEITGRVTGLDVTDWQDNLLKVQPSLLRGGAAARELVGRYIVVKNSERADGSYLIKDVRENATIVSVGDMTLVERFRDPSDYSKGVVYNVAAGDEFTIPLSVSFGAPGS